MNTPRDWDEQYLLNLPVGEFDWLEVKGRRGLDLTMPNVKEHEVKEMLAKAISAFANSGGGVLVIGLVNPKEQWHVDDGGVALNIKRSGTREWLEDIIPHLVDFPLSAFNVYVIQRTSEESQIAPGRGVFLIEIPDSDQAPHQSSHDHLYYARVGGKSRPIPHRLVADIFNRRRDPLIELSFYYETDEYAESGPMSLVRNPGEPARRIVDHNLVVQAVNKGRVYAKYVTVLLYIPLSLVPKEKRSDSEVTVIEGKRYYMWQRSNSRRDVIKNDLWGPSEYGPSWFDPLLPGRSRVWRWSLPETFLVEDTWQQIIRWEVYSDNAPMRQGVIRADDLEHRSISDR